MDNPKILITLGTRHRTTIKKTQKHNTTQKEKNEQHEPHQKPGVNLGAREG